MSIHERLPFFNKSGPIYRVFIGDIEREELPTITNINDINRGAIENAVEWHRRLQKRSVAEMNIREARGLFLRFWQDILGTPRPTSMTDEDFADYMVRKILATGVAKPQVFAAIPDALFEKFGSKQPPGGFSDVCHADVGPIPPSGPFWASSVVSFPRNAIYVVVRSADVITDGIRTRLDAAMAAGIAVFVAVIP
jgi:hypothetical protein